MIPQTAEYALRAVSYLINHPVEPVRRALIAEETCVSADYLHKILQELDRAGIVSTQRGPGGGYLLKADPTTLTLWDVYSVVADLPRIHSCPLGIKEHEQLCPLHQMLDDMTKTMEDSLKSTKILELMSIKPNEASCNFPGTKE
ncbi:MAG: Rrf2 family transcriptional regulator [Planctomycetales bacterium]|nr:Rrf2 family transcriptional regulator [Planctomycetales bacterium]